MSVRFSSDPGDLRRPEWAQLAASDPDATFFHTPEYLRLYWEELGGEAGVLLAGVEEAGSMRGAAAFEMDGTTLRFLGGTEVTDYTGPVAAPEHADAVAAELVQALLERDDWAEADLRGIAEDSRWLRRLTDAAARAGAEVEEAQDAIAPFLALPATLDEYLAALSGKLRHEIRRKARRLRAEAGDYTVRYATEESLEADLDRFVALHRSSEGPKGKFMQPGMEKFFRRLGREFLARGVFRLAFLEVDGKGMAAAIGFTYEGTFSLYNSAYDQRWRRLSPGMVLVAELIEDAIAGGCDAFDMLKGDLGYKYRFGSAPRSVRRLILRR